MKERDHLIWSSAGVMEYYSFSQIEYPDLNDEDRMEFAKELNDLDFQDISFALDIPVPQSIIRISYRNDVPVEYKETQSKNIQDCLTYEDGDVEWYVDAFGDFRCNITQDGKSTQYCYRVYKEGIRESQVSLLKDKIRDGIANYTDIARITRRLGDDIAKVYGFSISQPRQQAAEQRARA